MILDIFLVFVGLVLGFFLPGFFITLIFFKELEIMEKIGLGMVFSIAINIVLGLFLGYNEYMKELTGGITRQNVWFGLLAITFILASLYSIDKLRYYLLLKDV